VSRSNGGPSLLDGARLFASTLQERLEIGVEVCIRYDYASLLRSVVDQGVDLAWMPPLIHAGATAAGARLLALSQRGGLLGYRSALVVRSDSEYQRLQDLVAVRAAWVDRASSSGYLFPRLHLAAAGLDPARTFASERFFGAATTACRAVADGEADLAACFLSVASERQAAQREVADTFKTGNTLRVLDVTAKIPPDGLVLASSVEEPLGARIRSTLLTLHTDPGGREALKRLLQAEQLAPVEEHVVRELQRLVARAPA
jgi:phosphonate transport system substrate-binding protein